VLLERLLARCARVTVVGLGYVGLPLAIALADRGFLVAGVDVDPSRVDTVNAGATRLLHVSRERLARLVRAGRLSATTAFDVVSGSDAVCICVPTPVGSAGEPDLSYVESAARSVGAHLTAGTLVVLESTSYPGTTREVVLPLLTAGECRLVAGDSVFVAFSPERIDPGSAGRSLESTPRLVGGVTPACLEVASALYSQVVPEVVAVSSTDSAEMSKLVENTFRAVNIALANEVLLMCDALDLDVREVLDAAATKPFGFMKFAPGPGVGGHCIPVDPLHLSWRLRQVSYHARFIALASAVNDGMAGYWVRRVQDALSRAGRALCGASVLVLGVAYKRDVDDCRGSPALDLIRLLLRGGAAVSYHDPYIRRIRCGDAELVSVARWEEAVGSSDCVLLATDHSEYDRARVRRASPLLVDARPVES